MVSPGLTGISLGNVQKKNGDRNLTRKAASAPLSPDLGCSSQDTLAKSEWRLQCGNLANSIDKRLRRLPNLVKKVSHEQRT